MGGCSRGSKEELKPNKIEIKPFNRGTAIQSICGISDEKGEGLQIVNPILGSPDS